MQKKSFQSAVKVIGLAKRLQKDGEFALSKQLLRSGTGIGANVEEALAGQSRKDFASKMTISSKEARETQYWLRLMTCCPGIQTGLFGLFVRHRGNHRNFDRYG